MTITYPETTHSEAGTPATGIALDIRPLSGNIGAEIRGVDLKQPLDAETYAEIRATWLKYKVVFFPGQHLTPDAHRAFTAQFGELTPAHPVIPGIEGYPEVFEIDYGRARELYAGGHLRDALRLLDGIGIADPLRPHADRLRADIQRVLLAAVAAGSQASTPTGTPR